MISGSCRWSQSSRPGAWPADRPPGRCATAAAGSAAAAFTGRARRAGCAGASGGDAWRLRSRYRDGHAATSGVTLDVNGIVRLKRVQSHPPPRSGRVEFPRPHRGQIRRPNRRCKNSAQRSDATQGAARAGLPEGPVATTTAHWPREAQPGCVHASRAPTTTAFVGRWPARRLKRHAGPWPSLGRITFRIRSCPGRLCRRCTCRFRIGRAGGRARRH